MIENKFPTEPVPRTCDAREITIEGVDTVQYLYVPPRASVKRQPLSNQWEVLMRLTHKEAHVCLKNENIDIVNEDGYMLQLLVIRGHLDHSYEDFCEFFKHFGFTVHHGSLTVKDTSVSL